MNNARILIVDDEDAARLTLLHILQLEGFDVSGVENGVAALEELTRMDYQIMILDLKMPGMSGMEVLEAVSDRFPSLKVIILTAYGSFDSAVQALRLRVVDYLVKPVSPEVILTSVRQVLGWKENSNETDEVAENRASYDAGSSQPARFFAGENFICRLSNGVVVDIMRRRIGWNGSEIHLTAGESKLFGVLLANHSVVMHHQTLVYLIHGYRVEGREAAKILRPMLSRLNKKLEIIPGGEKWIKTVRGSGYVLEIDGCGEEMGG